MYLTTETLAVYEPLQFVVEVSEPGYRAGSFEALAAFNVGTVARRYAADCRTAHPSYSYRVRAREGDRFLSYEGTSGLMRSEPPLWRRL